MKYAMFSLTLLASSLSIVEGSAQELPDANQIVKNVNARNEGEHLSQTMNMTLTNKKGRSQIREMSSYRKDYPSERKTLLVFNSPSNVKGTGFLSYDYPDPKQEDDQWLYLPALRKTRRISAANRGDYFLGTDFTYEDIKLGTKMSSSDYSYRTLKSEMVDGHKCFLLEGTPINEKIKKELGYSKVQHWVDAEIWMIRKSEYWDIAGNPLKSTQVTNIQKIQGIWTFMSLAAHNHKTGHKTAISFTNNDYSAEVLDELFTEESLLRGGL